MGLDDTNRRMKTNEVSKTVDRDAVLLIPPTACRTHARTYAHILGEVLIKCGGWGMAIAILFVCCLIAESECPHNDKYIQIHLRYIETKDTFHHSSFEVSMKVEFPWGFAVNFSSGMRKVIERRGQGPEGNGCNLSRYYTTASFPLDYFIFPLSALSRWLSPSSHPLRLAPYWGPFL